MARERPPERRQIWDRFDEVTRWEPVNAERFPSAGHFGGRHKIEVRVSPEARAAYMALVPGVTLPAGTIVSAFHSEVRDGRPGPVLAMIKRASDWEYLSLDSQGTIEERGSLPLCRRCHAEAVADQLFGLPKH